MAACEPLRSFRRDWNHLPDDRLERVRAVVGDMRKERAAYLREVLDDLHRSQDIIDECNRNLKRLYARARRELGITTEQLELEIVRQREQQDSRKQSDGGRVYFLKVPDLGLVKIGFTRDLDLRLKALAVGIKRSVELVGTIDGDRVTERVLHYQLRQHREHGEFFSWVPVSEQVRGCIARNSALLSGALQ